MHGNHVHGRGMTDRTYVTWYNMKQRCFNPNSRSYKYYGGRGITVCAEWKMSFEAFLRDMGDRPLGMTLDRRNNNGNYEPSNCHWATPTEQARNQRPGGVKGVGNNQAKLTPSLVAGIKALLSQGESQEQDSYQIQGVSE